ncbi:MAG: hypothetical protein ABJC10_04520 [Acidobacteriota bacterium]
MNTKTRKSELGGARLKFLIVITIIAIVGYAGYEFIPVGYQAYQLKDLMQHDVDAAAALGKPESWVKEQLIKSSVEYSIPTDAVISTQLQSNRMEVRVQFTKPMEFPGYVYNYEFDYTARSSTFLTIR